MRRRGDYTPDVTGEVKVGARDFRVARGGVRGVRGACILCGASVQVSCRIAWFCVGSVQDCEVLRGKRAGMRGLGGSGQQTGFNNQRRMGWVCGRGVAAPTRYNKRRRLMSAPQPAVQLHMLCNYCCPRALLSELRSLSGLNFQRPKAMKPLTSTQMIFALMLST